VPIPEPLALGRPTEAFPRPWSIYRWIDGEIATSETVADTSQLARDLASFLNALYAIPPDETAPRPDQFNLRGGPLGRLDAWTRSALAGCKGELDTKSALAAWDRSLGALNSGSPVWVHGDVAATNLLVRDGNLTAVIDFGCLAVGDPACDLMIAWTFLERESRAVFRQTLDIDNETWERGRGWALWKAALVLEDELTGAGTQPHWQHMGWICDAKSVIKRLLTE
jgi:aminoglycoside phosphotransferase (APT) family kinase protein